MQEKYFKVEAARAKAAVAWANWEAVNNSCREAFYTFMKAAGGEGEAYARYTEACLNRDAYYAEAMEAAEDFWRQECNAEAKDCEGGSISFAGPAAARWKEIYQMSPPAAGVKLID